MTKVVFKTYSQAQIQLLPMSYEELIPENHLVRIVNLAIEKMAIEPLISSYKGGGTSSYHPKMLLKVLIYAYIEKIYSSRNIAKALRENINFMWLSGGSRPDFRTINGFRSTRLKDSIEKIFASMVSLLAEGGYINLDKYFCDGTKIEANANKYSFVWGRATQKFKQRLQDDVKALFAEIDNLNALEDHHYGKADLEEMGQSQTITAEMLEQKIEVLNQALEKSPKDKTLKRAKKKIEKDYLPRQSKYQEQEKTLQGRGSYSKTDTDATFMRMKEDHMKNGQLKAGYNVQIGTENQFILHYSLHQKSNDTTTLIPHLKDIEKKLPRKPKTIIADAGYGSEENYTWLEENNFTALVKYSFFDKDINNKRINPFLSENFPYNKQQNTFTCPAGKLLHWLETKEVISENSYKTTREMYKAENCSGCQYRHQCHNGQGNRVIQVSHKLKAQKNKVRQLLTSPEGEKLRKQRGVDVEPVFGNIKQNMGFKRFALRGIKKVNIEFGLIAMAHNFIKVKKSARFTS